MAANLVRCTPSIAKSVRGHIDGIIEFVRLYKWITDAYVSDFFHLDLWSKLPPQWQAFLSSLTTQELSWLLDPQTHISSAVPPLSLLAYRKCAHSLSLPRGCVDVNSEEVQQQLHSVLSSESDLQEAKAKDVQLSKTANGDSASQGTSSTADLIGKPGQCVYADDTVKNGQYLALDPLFRRHVKPKKQHEILQLGKAVSTLCGQCGCERVVDVGAGLGHLSRLLSFGHGLRVTTVEATGGHAPKAEKFDRDVQKEMKKAKQKRKADGSTPDQAPLHSQEPEELPQHVVATISTDISTSDFLTMVQQQVSQPQPDSGLSEKRPQDVTQRAQATEIPNTSGNCSGENAEAAGGAGDSVIESCLVGVRKNEEDNDWISESETCRLETKKTKHCESKVQSDFGGFSALLHASHSSASDEARKDHLGKHCEQCDSSGRAMCGNNGGQEDGRASACHNGEGSTAHNSSQIKNELDSGATKPITMVRYSGTGTSAALNLRETSLMAKDENCDASREDDTGEKLSMVGLHACGDLTATMLRVFVQSQSIVGLASVACCYMKLSAAGSSGEARKEAGYPMSDYVSKLPAHQLSYAAREMACHFADSYNQRLKESPPHLRVHGYRAALQHVIMGLNPCYDNGCMKLTIKNAVNMPFEQYARLGLRRLGMDGESERAAALIREAEQFLPRWRDVVAFYTLRLSLGPVLESLLLLDRMLFLQEHGISSILVPIFNPDLSPRNFVLLARKRGVDQ